MPGLRIEFPDMALNLDRKNVRKVLRQAGAEVAKLARRIIRQATGTGRAYYYDGRRIVASAAGQAPVSRSGALAGSITVTTTKSGMAVKVTDRAGFALALEAGAVGGGGRNAKGTSNRKLRKATGNKLAQTTSRVLLPRPFLTTALDEKADDIGPRIKAAIIDGIEFKPKKSKRTP